MPSRRTLRCGPFLAAVLQEAGHVLVIEIRRVGGQGLGRAQSLAVAREDIPDFALGDGHQRHDVDAVLEREKELETARAGLWAGTRLRPPSAMNPPVTEPWPLHSFSQMPMRLFGMYRTKPDSRTKNSRQNHRPDDVGRVYSQLLHHVSRLRIGLGSDQKRSSLNLSTAAKPLPSHTYRSLALSQRQVSEYTRFRFSHLFFGQSLASSSFGPVVRVTVATTFG